MRDKEIENIKTIRMIAFLAVSIQAAFGICPYRDPNIPRPTSGYGANGSHPVAVDSFVNPNWAQRHILVYHPADIAGLVPTVFYNHAFGANDPAFVCGVLNFIAQNGYAVVFVPYQTVGVTVPERYKNLLDGFRAAVLHYPAILDTTKVGFLGWSFGGGAAFANAYACFTENKWGQQGRFIFSLAPWYCYNISELQLKSFPKDVKLLIETFDEDTVNDHRMAIDMYRNVVIPDSNKDFITVRSDTIGGYVYYAGHSLPNSVEFDALDYYAYFRLLDALCDYTFNGNSAGKAVALGKGFAGQVTMPAGLKSLVESDSPQPLYPESKYKYPCGDTANPRVGYCNSAIPVLMPDTRKLTDGAARSSKTVRAGMSSWLSVPVPETGAKVTIVNAQGIVMKVPMQFSRTSVSVDISGLRQGIYLILTGNYHFTFVHL